MVACDESLSLIWSQTLNKLLVHIIIYVFPEDCVLTTSHTLVEGLIWVSFEVEICLASDPTVFHDRLSSAAHF